MDCTTTHDESGIVAACCAGMYFLLYFPIFYCFRKIIYKNELCKIPTIAIFYSLAVMTVTFRILAMSFFAYIDLN